jgi:hypothetical protein
MVRRSTRHVVADDGSSTTDEDSLEKAMRRKAAMNLDFTGMSSKSSSFISLSTPVISSKLHAVGIRLGKNASEVYMSANVLRHMEDDRLTVRPKLQNIVENTESDEEEAIATMNGQLLSSLVGVVSEIDLDETMSGSLYDMCASGCKSKSTSSSRASKRGRVPKSKIVS